MARFHRKTLSAIIPVTVERADEGPVRVESAVKRCWISTRRMVAADRLEKLVLALQGSHSLVTARSDGRLVGLGNAKSDAYSATSPLFRPELPSADFDNVGLHELQLRRHRRNGRHLSRR